MDTNICIMNIGGCEFVSSGSTLAKAEAALLRGWKKHQRQTGVYAEIHTLERMDDYFGIQRIELPHGSCVRDGMEIN